MSFALPSIRCGDADNPPRGLSLSSKQRISDNPRLL